MKFLESVRYIYGRVLPHYVKVRIVGWVLSVLLFATTIDIISRRIAYSLMCLQALLYAITCATMHRRELPERGWGLWRQEWYSICSMHSVHDENCRMCTCGTWINVWTQMFGSAVFKIAPELWRRWKNRKSARSITK
jgi:hypothetical protein